MRNRRLENSPFPCMMTVLFKTSIFLSPFLDKPAISYKAIYFYLFRLRRIFLCARKLRLTNFSALLHNLIANSGPVSKFYDLFSFRSYWGLLKTIKIHVLFS